MTSFQWSFDSSLKLAGIGIDAEHPSRFIPYLNDSHPFPFIFSSDEAGFAFRSANPSRAFCAAFCCKEALFKATGIPYNFTDCELLESISESHVELRLSESFRNDYGIASAIARIFDMIDSSDEIVSAVMTFKPL